MVTKMILVHFLNKEVFETIREWLNNLSKTTQNKNLTYTFYYEPVVEIGLWETDRKKPVHTYIMQTTFDCTKRVPETDFYKWVMDLYHEKFSVRDIAGFPVYDQFICDYAEYEIYLPVDDADRALAKITSKGNWQPEQLDKTLWDNYKRKFGQNNFYFSKDGKMRFIIRACCDGTLLKKKCGDPAKIRVNGVDPDYVLDPETEELFMSGWKCKVMSANRVNKSAYKPDDIKKVLPDEYKTVASEFIDLAAKHDLKNDVRYTPAKKSWKCVYTMKKSKRVIFTVFASPEGFRIKTNLFGIDKYLSDYTLTETIKQQLLNNCWDCGDCHGNCRKGVRFTLDGQAYYKCIGGAFTFVNLDAAGFRKIIELTERELKENE